ncbi:PAS domain S-box protein [Pseudoalteromonas sp. B62]|uniref:PAS domain S-box protein n=1 Tax=Pseudoalteromonas sp. B62 TaxID=630483 RepID=UPI00301E61D1
MVVITFIVISLPSLYLFEKKVRSDVYNTAQIELKRELETKTLSLKKHFKDSVTAIRFLDATPPIQGISRASEHKLIDPLLGTPIAVWQERLASIFSGFMRTDESILQARYITLADGGREVVRVDRTELGSLVRLDGEQLQQKGQRDYVIKASILDANSVYISPINYNRENGEIQQPYISTFRVAKPVFDEHKQVFAVLVTNYFADELFKSLIVESPRGIAIYLMNNEGEFLYHPDTDLRFGFEFNQSRTWDDEFNEAEEMSVGNTLPINSYPQQYYLKKRIYFEGDIAMLPLELAVSLNTHDLLLKVSERRQNFIILLVVFFSIFLIITSIYQRFINRKLLIHSLKEQNNKVIENSLDAIFTIEETGQIVHFNNTAKNVFGSTLKDKENDFISLFNLNKADINCIEETIIDGAKMPFEAIYTDAFGNKQFYSITLSSIFDVYNNRYQVAAILRNITSLKNIQSELEGLNSTLELKVSQRTIELERAMRSSPSSEPSKK